MTTSDVKITAGAGTNVATYDITEDAETKKIQRVAINDSAGADAMGSVGTAAVSTDSTGTALQFLRGIVKLLAGTIHVDVPSGNANLGNDIDAIVAAPINAAPVLNFNYGFNGTTWDRLRVDGGKNLKVAPSVSASANGLTSSRVKAAATTNATSLKASAGNIASIDVFNVAAYSVFLQLYNKASAPTVGTDVPVWTIPIAAGTGFSRSFPTGKSFATGIAYAITKLQADTDTTAVVANDLTGSIDWI